MAEASILPTSRTRAPGLWTGYAAVFLAAAILYLLTAARTIQWRDSGLFALRAWEGQLVNPMGLALSHPLQFWLSFFAIRTLPLEPAHAASLVSGIAGALAVANVFGIVRLLTGRWFPALLAAASLAVANTFWRMSTIPQTYTIVTALVTVEIWMWVAWSRTRQRRWLLLMFLANGLALSDHNLALLSLPATGIILLLALHARQATWKTMLGCFACWLGGASIYLGLVGKVMWSTGEVGPTLRAALFGHAYAGAVAGLGITWKLPAINIAFTLLSFPNLALPAAAWGLLQARRSGMPDLARRALLATLVIHLAFVLRYNIVDPYQFLMPAYAMLTIFAGIGFAQAMDPESGMRRIRIGGIAAILVLLTPAIYPAATALLRRTQVLGDFQRDKPYRDDYQYLFIPWGSAQTSADVMSQKAVDLAGDRGLIIVEDGMGAFAVRYHVRLAQGRGIEVAEVFDPALIRTALSERRTVVVVPIRRGAISQEFAFCREGELFVLPPR